MTEEREIIQGDCVLFTLDHHNTHETASPDAEETYVIEMDSEIEEDRCSNLEYDLQLVSIHGGVYTFDDKNTDEFKYLTFNSFPTFGPSNNSLLRKHLTREIFETLKHKITNSGYSLSNAIISGILNSQALVGIRAGDRESYECFKEIMFPVIRELQGFDATTQTQVHDLNPEKIIFPESLKQVFDIYCIYTKISFIRNFDGFLLPSGTNNKDRELVESLFLAVLNTFSQSDDLELHGTYHSLDKKELISQQTDSNSFSYLNKRNLLIPTPSSGGQLALAASGAARVWPINRGIFVNKSKSVVCWLNEEDHLQIIAFEDGGDVLSVFSRLCKFSAAFQLAIRSISYGVSYMHDGNLGYITSCPSNLGTGTRATISIRLNTITKEDSKIQETMDDICERFDLKIMILQLESIGGETGSIVEISNKHTMGKSEVQIIQQFTDGVGEIIKLETQSEINTNPGNPDPVISTIEANPEITDKKEADIPDQSNQIEEVGDSTKSSPSTTIAPGVRVMPRSLSKGGVVNVDIPTVSASCCFKLGYIA